MMIARALAVVCVVAAAAPVYAQSVEAEVLFRDGKKLLKEGKIAEACDKLEASDRLEASVGTELNLADCREKNGQLATAWAAFRKAAASAKTAGDAKREAEARRRAGALEAKMSYLTINVGDKLEGLQVARNGTAIDPALWNAAVPVDPGEYEIVAQAPGHDRWSSRIKVASDAQHAAVDVPKLKAAGEAAVDKKPMPTEVKPKPAEAKAKTEPDEQPEPPAPAHASSFTGTRKIAVAVGVLGVAGIAVGAVFGSKANDLESQSNKICPTATCNDMHALQLNSDAKSDALISNIGFIGGGAAVAGAVVLWFVGAPKAAQESVAVTPLVGRTSVGLGLGGRF